MALWLKRGSTAAATRQENDRQVRETVERILADIATNGDEAVRRLSVQFDKLDRDSYELTPAEIDACIATLSPRDIKDIEFPQTQVRTFAQNQRETILDLGGGTRPA